MLISTKTKITWNSRNKKHYLDKGYNFTKIGDQVEVDVNDLTKGSQASITVKCDYCGKLYNLQWVTYMAMKKRTLQTDCCKDCLEIKASESVEKKYGNHKKMFESSNDKRRATIIEKFGCENVFESDEIKKKIIKTNMERYGVPYTQQNKEVRAKTQKTCSEKYGVNNYVELFRGVFIKENSPTWKGGVDYSRVERATYDYNQWRKLVFERDQYTCKACGARNGQGSYVELNAHHIKNWKDNPECRYDVENGITLCGKCHTLFHSEYGKRNNSYAQLDEFLRGLLDKEIC